MPFTNIVAAVDFSAATKPVIEQALAFALSSAGTVNLVHAFSLSELSESALRRPGAMHEAQAFAEREMRNIAEEYLASGRVGRLIVREGDAAGVLRKVAEEVHADLIVVDTYHRGFARFARGSVAEALTRDAPCAVLVLRSVADL